MLIDVLEEERLALSTEKSLYFDSNRADLRATASCGRVGVIISSVSGREEVLDQYPLPPPPPPTQNVVNNYELLVKYMGL